MIYPALRRFFVLFWSLWVRFWLDFATFFTHTGMGPVFVSFDDSHSLFWSYLGCLDGPPSLVTFFIRFGHFMLDSGLILPFFAPKLARIRFSLVLTILIRCSGHRWAA